MLDRYGSDKVCERGRYKVQPHRSPAEALDPPEYPYPLPGTESHYLPDRVISLSIMYQPYTSLSRSVTCDQRSPSFQPQKLGRAPICGARYQRHASSSAPQCLIPVSYLHTRDTDGRVPAQWCGYVCITWNARMENSHMSFLAGKGAKENPAPLVRNDAFLVDILEPLFCCGQDRR